MTDAFTGGCACGAVRYDIGDEPVAMNHCECRHCQLRSGTGHGSYLTFASRAAVRVTGQVGEWEAVGEGGTVKRYSFCAACGSPVYLTFPQMPDVFVVHAGSLDDPGRFKPDHVLYATRAHAWDVMDPKLTAFAQMPPRAAPT
jgi:hypothetical protein